MIYEFKQMIPFVHPTAFVHPQAAVTGNVEIGKDVYIGPGAAIRGDFGRIVISNGCNVQENCVLHSFPGAEVLLLENVHVGHGAILHGCVAEANCLIGMNAVIMDNAVLGEECIVGALSFIQQGSKFERRSLIVGNPAKMIKEVSDEMIRWKSEGTMIYQQLARDMHLYWRETSPLRTKKDQPGQSDGYKPWQKAEE